MNAQGDYDPIHIIFKTAIFDHVRLFWGVVSPEKVLKGPDASFFQGLIPSRKIFNFFIVFTSITLYGRRTSGS